MASRTPSGRKSNKEPRSADSPTAPPPMQSVTPLPPADQIVVGNSPAPFVEDLGDLTDLGVMESVTVSALISAAVGDSDDDALGLNVPPGLLVGADEVIE